MTDARCLHGWLEVGDRFDQWLKRRCREYGFTEGDDFCSHKNVQAKGRGGHNRKDYLLTLDMAKELSMIERTDKGRAARRYFIAMEKAAVTMASTLAAEGRPEAIPEDRPKADEIPKLR